MPSREETIERGRAAAQQRAWGTAYAHLWSAEREAPLDPRDLEALATAAHFTGRGLESAELLARAHHRWLAAGQAARAARCAFWLSFGAMNEGEGAQAGGWLARARRVLDEADLDCVERGYLALLEGIRGVRQGDATGARAALEQATAIGRRFGEADLVALAIHGQGRALVGQGEVARGVGLLDESMVAVQAGELSPQVVGGLYCSVLEACRDVCDLRRAGEWTDALERWCASQAEAVPFRAHCLVHRAELRRIHGEWPEALAEARRARELLSIPRPRPGAGAARALEGDLHRLRGELAQAEEAYAEAVRWDPRPRPGPALLRLARGEGDAARAALRQAAAEAREPGPRAAVLDACVDVAIGAGDAPAARAAADELAGLAARLAAPWLDGLAQRALGAVLLEERGGGVALPALRRSLERFRELRAPYEAARAQLAIAVACGRDGDCDAAELELGGARAVLARLGARPDLARLDAIARRLGRRGGADDGLTARERQVLRLVASGRTNRDIAAALGISEKTVARHLGNIFAKLGLGSRAAATAYAFRHDLVGGQAPASQDGRGPG